MTEKRFIEFMTQNSDDGKLNHGFEDMVREEWYHTKDEITAKKCVDLLNEQEETINELKQRNQRQYKRLKELTELMYEKQWEKLENMVEEWEKQDELLEQEWGTYDE